jgi:membrane protein DedA with SNARE-associated domain
MDIAGTIAAFSYPAVLCLLLACGLGAPLSEDAIVIAGGLLVSQGKADLLPMMATAYLGQVGGDFLLYRLGRSLGPRALARPSVQRIVTPARREVLLRHFEKHGALTVFAARCVPGFRAPTFLMAGVSGFPPMKFVLADAAAALITAPLLTYLGFHFGLVALEPLRRGAHWIFLAVLAVAAFSAGRALWRRRALLRAWLLRPRSGILRKGA